MKNFRAILLGLVILLPASAFARIGETPTQCETRYGKAIKKTEDGIVLFRKKSFYIGIIFHQGKADKIFYSKVDDAEELSDNEIETFIKSNGHDKKWKAVSFKTLNETEDGTLFAIIYKKTLIIATKERMDRDEAWNKAKEKKLLEGF